ncbi:MAG: amino acid ABC transporter permease [Clostridia bacterium]|nr:amino acid ABC transporter permease [Clostridia bacterium]
MLREVLLSLANGFLQSLQLFCYTLLGGLPLGLVIAFGSMAKWKPLQMAVRGLVWVVRGTPLMLQLIVIYYGPGLLLKDGNLWGGGTVGRMGAAAAAFILNYACYFSEIYRGGIESIPKGQTEAGRVLGLTEAQIFFRVKLQQIYKRILPPMGNEVITLVKDTCLARIIAIYELTYAGQAYIKSDGLIWPLLLTGVFYLLFSGLLSWLLKREEARLAYFE